jgi:hypothetical protein
MNVFHPGQKVAWDIGNPRVPSKSARRFADEMGMIVIIRSVRPVPASQRQYTGHDQYVGLEGTDLNREFSGLWFRPVVDIYHLCEAED